MHPHLKIIENLLKYGLSQAEIAKLAGTTQPTISRLKNGVNVPSFAVLQGLNRVYEATHKDFWNKS